MKSISKKSICLLLNIYILCQPILDILTSLNVRYFPTALTIGIVVRFVFVACCGGYVLFFYRGTYKKTLKLFVVSVSVYGMAFLFSTVYNNGIGVLFTNVKMFVKMYYCIYVFIALYALWEEYHYVVSDKILTIVFVMYTTSIFLSAITDTSFGTYEYAAGYCGWFYAGNEIGAIVYILAIGAIWWSFKNKNIFFTFLCIFLTSFTSVYIGTKVPFLAICMATLILGGFYFVAYLKHKNKEDLIFLIKILILILGIGVLYYFNSPIKQNNQTMVEEHYEQNVVERIEDESLQEIENGVKPIHHSKAYLIVNWLLSNRLIMYEDAIIRYEEGSILEKAFGLGYDFNIGDKRFTSEIEMDFVALLVNHGWVGLIIYILPILIWVFICIRGIIKNIGAFLKMPQIIVYGYSCGIGAVCAALAGHVLISPAVSIYIAIYMVKLYAFFNIKNFTTNVRKYTSEDGNGCFKL